MAPAPLSVGFQSLPLLPTIKLGPSGAGSRVGGLVHTRPLWVSPANSPVRLGVSPTAAPSPMVFSLRGLRLYFPALEPWVTQSALIPAICPVYLCANVGPHGLLPAALPAPFSATLSPALSVYLCANVGQQSATCHSACRVLRQSESSSLGLSVHECVAAGSASVWTACPIRPSQSGFHHSNSSLLCPGCPSPPLLPVWMNVYFLSPWCRTSLSFDFLSVLVVRGGAVCLPTPPSWFSN